MEGIVNGEGAGRMEGGWREDGGRMEGGWRGASLQLERDEGSKGVGTRGSL
jgi:hypothetical protein